MGSRSSRTRPTRPARRWTGRALGTFGAVGCFSFFSNKNLPVGEGGMVVTSDDAHRRSAAPAALARDDDADVAAASRSCERVRRGRARSQLPPRRAARGARHRAARPARRRERRQARTRPSLSERPRRSRRTRRSRFARRSACATRPTTSRSSCFRTGSHATTFGKQRARRASRRASTTRRSTASRRTRSAADARPLPRTDAVAERILTLPLFPHMTPADVDLVAEVVLDAVRRCMSQLCRV